MAGTNILNVGYDSTNYYLLTTSAPKLLVDIGWPGTLPKLLRALQRYNLQLKDIPYALATHYHPDHAGLAQEAKKQDEQNNDNCLLHVDHLYLYLPPYI